MEANSPDHTPSETREVGDGEGQDIAALPMRKLANGNLVTGITCGKCGAPTVECEYYWSGFGDSYDNFQHRCTHTACGNQRERLGIPGRFPQENPDDWTPCPFCGRSSWTRDHGA